MRKILTITVLSVILCLLAVKSQSQSLTRIYLNSSVKTYSIDSKSLFTSSLVEGLASGGGEDNALDIAELFSFFQNNKLAADTVTYGKNEPGSDFIFTKKEKKSKGKYYALIAYVEDYDTFDDLQGVAPDMEKIKSSLTNTYGFQVETLANVTRAGFLLAIRKYTTMEYGKDDKLFIYFAGRGYFDDLYKWNYLLLKDSKKDDEVKYSYMPVSQLLMLADNIPVNKVMVVVDAGTK